MKARLLTIFLLATCSLAQAEWKPVPGKMLTPWASKIDPASVWAEYPRPQLRRDDWTNLNGLWQYAVAAKDATRPADWAGEILVPFCPESALSGVGRLIEPDESLWYKRPLPAAKPGLRSILHFEAVDYLTSVRVNGKEVGTHQGGHTPFSFDITDALKESGNELVVRVHDATEGLQLHGKQKLEPGGIWYTRVTGIWQSVWLENVAPRHIEDLHFSCDIKAGSITVETTLAGPEIAGEQLRITVYSDQKPISVNQGASPMKLGIPDPKLWSPSEPNLYDLKIELLDGGTVVDTVMSYTALREFGKARDAKGNWRFTLNGKSIFHWGPLDQGWWPDGLLTPPSDEAMLSDIRFLKEAGFNMIRKHIKVEPRRYYHHLDRLGMLMWQDQVSQGYGPDSEPKGSNPPWTRLAPDPKDGVWPKEAADQFVVEYKAMVDHLRDHPCIAVWVPFNEAWGQHNTMAVGGMAVDYDMTRPINIASGGNFWPVGDIADEHAYPDPAFPVDDERFDNYLKVVGEFGGHGWPVKGHLWKEDNANWGYGGLPETLDEWKERFARSITVLAGLRKRGVCAGVYTQTTDVEVEINGLLTYDRVRKIDPAWLKQQSDRLLGTADVVDIRVVLPTSEEAPQEWSYTTESPAAGWERTDFDSSSWKTGKGGFGTRETPNSAVGTTWDSRDIWLRREFQLDALPQGLTAIRLYHDEDAEIFLNGTRVLSVTGHNGNYGDLPVALDTLKTGSNVIAVHCRQTTGGQFIDLGIIEEIPR